MRCTPWFNPNKGALISTNPFAKNIILTIASVVRWFFVIDRNTFDRTQLDIAIVKVEMIFFMNYHNGNKGDIKITKGVFLAK